MIHPTCSTKTARLVVLDTKRLMSHTSTISISIHSGDVKYQRAYGYYCESCTENIPREGDVRRSAK